MKWSLVLPGLIGALAATEVRAAGPDPRAEAQAFLDVYNSLYQRISTVSAEAAWRAATDVTPGHEGERTAAGQAQAAFYGDPVIVRTARRLLERRAELEPLQVRQLEVVMLRAGDSPGTLPDLVNQRVAAESRAGSILDGYSFCFTPRAADGTCAAPKVANDVDEVLQKSVSLDERLRVWEASKDIGRPLKASLEELRSLRNQLAREMGYSSYFGLAVADYGMTVPEMMKLLDGMVVDMAPLYKELSVWATRQLAAKYSVPPPTGQVPAHWYPNRWAQEWGGLVVGADLDPYFKDRTPEWIVQQAERFYVSMGFAPLPKSFWEKSDLYPVPAGETRSKNSHASAWHVDLNDDVRSLMSVKADSQWFFTSHHELGHIYYDRAYSRPEVPYILREGANRAFHEGVGELISLAAGQVPYLRQQGLLPPKAKLDTNQAMLVDALERTVAFIPWSAGVMSHFEYELYEKDLPAAQWQARWWDMVGEYQGVTPPTDRRSDPTACDACTKTHIIDDPAGYYDYAIATVIKYQLHEHICAKILQEDPHSCNYFGHTEVGDFLKGVLSRGATEDWRKVLRDATGEDLSTRAMVAYFAPLQTWLAKENKKAAGRPPAK